LAFSVTALLQTFTPKLCIN